MAFASPHKRYGGGRGSTLSPAATVRNPNAAARGRFRPRRASPGGGQRVQAAHAAHARVLRRSRGANAGLPCSWFVLHRGLPLPRPAAWVRRIRCAALGRRARPLRHLSGRLSAGARLLRRLEAALAAHDNTGSKLEEAHSTLRGSSGARWSRCGLEPKGLDQSGPAAWLTRSIGEEGRLGPRSGVCAHQTCALREAPGPTGAGPASQELRRTLLLRPLGHVRTNFVGMQPKVV